ncbi:MAG: SMC-Scp complex subunit ScpB [Alphaproteobacteria bacterium]|nr:SMC-Scp complex subunit ScpB [Alphaproteobacteria bacterium]
MAEPDRDDFGPDTGTEAEPELHEVRQRQKRVIEALLFASAEPLSPGTIGEFVGEDARIDDLLAELAQDYAGRGVNLVVRGGLWALRTAEDLAHVLRREQTERKPLGRAVLETLAVVAYHQPVTRAEIEDIRGVAMNKGVLDVLLEAGFIRMRGRRRTPGRPITYGTTLSFLDHFGLEQLRDLPGLDEFKGAGLLSGQVPADLQIPIPFDGELHPDEDPLEDGDPGEDDTDVELDDDTDPEDRA